MLATTLRASTDPDSIRSPRRRNGQAPSGSLLARPVRRRLILLFTGRGSRGTLVGTRTCHAAFRLRAGNALIVFILWSTLLALRHALILAFDRTGGALNTEFAGSGDLLLRHRRSYEQRGSNEST